MLGTLIPREAFKRDEVRAQMAQLPPPPADDVAFLVENADLLREDYAAAGLEVLDATAYGHRQKVIRYGVGALAGLVVGAGAVLLLKGK